MKEVGSILNITTRTGAFHKYKMMQALGSQQVRTWYATRSGTTELLPNAFMLVLTLP